MSTVLVVHRALRSKTVHSSHKKLKEADQEFTKLLLMEADQEFITLLTSHLYQKCRSFSSFNRKPESKKLSLMSKAVQIQTEQLSFK